MSGGHWQYCGYKILDACEEIEQDEEVKKRFPELSQIIGSLGRWLYDVEHELDWDLSYDTKIVDDRKFEKEKINELLSILRKY
uniref:Uncharacterized protein n=1 Tax=viral metagenome TaxID=1070528 RepID=A0A6M3LBK4_9ZZZZ